MTVATGRLFLRGLAYLRDDGSEELISKSTWALKATGLLFGALLVVGRTASAGNIVWNPTHHSATTPLLVISAAVQKSGQPSRQAPKSPPGSDPAALAKRAAAHEVIAFSPGKDSSDGTEGGAAMSQLPQPEQPELPPARSHRRPLQPAPRARHLDQLAQVPPLAALAPLPPQPSPPPRRRPAPQARLQVPSPRRQLQPVPRAQLRA